MFLLYKINLIKRKSLLVVIFERLVGIQTASFFYFFPPCSGILTLPAALRPEFGVEGQALMFLR